jgi:hypothetical protein
VETYTQLALSKGLNRVGVSPSHLRTETNPFSETVCFLIFKISNYGQDLLCGLVVRVPDYRYRGPIRFPTLPDFLRSSRSGTGSTQPREYN